VIDRISWSKASADARHRDIPHRAQVAGDLGAMERWLHEAPLPVVALAFRHHEPVAYQPLGPAEVEALLQLPGLADQRLPDGVRAVQDVNVKRPEPDADHIAVLPCPLEQRKRVAAELQHVPEQPSPAGHQGDVTRDLLASQGHLPRLRPHPSLPFPGPYGAERDWLASAP
jgi:hypothetical protein